MERKVVLRKNFGENQLLLTLKNIICILILKKKKFKHSILPLSLLLKMTNYCYNTRQLNNE